jgi:hypothetical protein
MWAKQVIRDSSEAGIAKRTLDAAKAQMRVRSKKAGTDGWQWSLPEKERKDATEEAEERAPRNVRDVRNLRNLQKGADAKGAYVKEGCKGCKGCKGCDDCTGEHCERNLPSNGHLSADEGNDRSEGHEDGCQCLSCVLPM